MRVAHKKTDPKINEVQSLRVVLVAQINLKIEASKETFVEVDSCCVGIKWPLHKDNHHFTLQKFAFWAGRRPYKGRADYITP